MMRTTQVAVRSGSILLNYFHPSNKGFVRFPSVRYRERWGSTGTPGCVYCVYSLSTAVSFGFTVSSRDLPAALADPDTNWDSFPKFQIEQESSSRVPSLAHLCAASIAQNHECVLLLPDSVEHIRRLPHDASALLQLAAAELELSDDARVSLVSASADDIMLRNPSDADLDRLCQLDGLNPERLTIERCSRLSSAALRRFCQHLSRHGHSLHVCFSGFLTAVSNVCVRPDAGGPV
jgi:hypothetical protein